MEKVITVCSYHGLPTWNKMPCHATNTRFQGGVMGAAPLISYSCLPNWIPVCKLNMQIRPTHKLIQMATSLAIYWSVSGCHFTTLQFSTTYRWTSMFSLFKHMFISFSVWEQNQLASAFSENGEWLLLSLGNGGWLLHSFSSSAMTVDRWHCILFFKFKDCWRMDITTPDFKT